jgi:hypothetical protein
MRALLAEERHGLDVSRLTTAAVIEQIATLLASGRVHVHADAPRTEAPPTRSASTPRPPAPPPPPRRAPPPRLSRAAEVLDPPTFPVGTDLAAQAAAAVKAAAAGTPFCPI